MSMRGEVFSVKKVIGKRTYFFNIKENRHGDLFLNIVESKKGPEGDAFERHSMMVFKEDLEPFLEGFEQAVEFLRNPKEDRRSE